MQARRFLLFHPWFLLSLFTLILNDHFFKQEFPGWITGKLSDFAGLIVFACVVFVVLKRVLTSSRRIILAHVLVGILFTLWKTLPTESFFIAVSQATGLPGISVTRDLSDLIALAILPVSYWLIKSYLVPAVNPSLVLNLERCLRSIAFAASCFAIIATTPPWFVHVNEERIRISHHMSEARLLFIVEQTLIKQGFLIDDRTSYGPGRYSFGFHSRDKNWAPIKLDSSWVVPKLYDAELFINGELSGGHSIGPIRTRLGRKGWDSPIDSLIALNILNPLRVALGVTSAP